MCCASRIVETAHQLGSVVGQALEGVASRGASQPGEADATPSIYEASSVPDIGLSDYLGRWVRYTRCGPEVLLVAVIYIDRVCEHTGLRPSITNVHRLLLAALVVATKWQYDCYPSNPSMATIGGVHPSDLSRLERTLLGHLDWRAEVPVPLYDAYATRFAKRGASSIAPASLAYS
eukprot:TRINITY_DN46949_c0_g1_i1.p2 TRINITY_DN46949_c0_g1~~TRINITY_DN46949_c0_g1_i1.p2  ORF type:complete len:176 (+),score=47.03 TRINITY_DN46949_c0_g1_i1:49-576(+)